MEESDYAGIVYKMAVLFTFLLVRQLVMVAFGISAPGIRMAGGLVSGILGF